ncbi:MAG: hypothetical protein HQL72_14540 [Magnetococcales bacterium]|nr:hypothetical protein [Magnetococcales bacterium]
MDKAQLLASAQNLISVSPQTVEEYTNKRESLVAELNAIMSERSDLEKMIGADHQSMMNDNHTNHSRFIESLLRHYEAGMLVDTVLWVFRAYRSHGFNLTYWPAQLNGWMTVLKQSLSASAYTEIEPLYQWLIVNQSSFVTLTDQT